MRKKVRQVSLLIVFTLVLSLFSMTQGYMQKADNAILVKEIDYSDLLIDEGKEDTSSSGSEVRYLCETEEEAGEKLREGFKNRKRRILIELTEKAAQDVDYYAFFKKFYEIALEHTGVGDEGDYLHWNMTTLSPTYNKKTHIFTIKVTYLSDAAMEKATTGAIRKLEEQLSIKSSDSAFEKLQIIYDYLARHITYETKDKSNLPFSTYDAIVNGRAVCQGYATLLYRMLLDYGIDNRIIVSETHAWNLVGINGKYYECDLTWDSQGVQEGRAYQYLLKANLAKNGDTDHEWKLDDLDADVSKLTRATTDYTAQSNSVPTLTVSKTGSSVNLKWSSVKAAQGYYIYRKTGSGSWKKIAETTGTTYTDKDQKKGSCTYRVQPYYTILKGSYSKAKKIVR